MNDEITKAVALAKELLADFAHQNALKDPTYAPYCMICPGLKRAKIVAPFVWHCDCGGTRDDRIAMALVALHAETTRIKYTTGIDLLSVIPMAVLGADKIDRVDFPELFMEDDGDRMYLDEAVTRYFKRYPRTIQEPVLEEKR